MDGRLRWLRVEPADSWPGLARLWQKGSLSGLLIAVIYSILLNATLTVVLIWPGMLPAGIKGFLAAALAAAWVAGWLDARRLRRHEEWKHRRDPQLDLFLSARGEYLKSNWQTAERQLRQLLSESPEDVEARLMLATLLRHAGRLAEAKEQLRRLQRRSRAAIWNLEIRHEWEQLSKQECSADWGEPDTTNDSATGGDEFLAPARNSVGREAA